MPALEAHSDRNLQPFDIIGPPATRDYPVATPLQAMGDTITDTARAAGDQDGPGIHI